MTPDLKWLVESGSSVAALVVAYLILRLPAVSALLMRLAGSGSDAVIVKGVVCDEAALRRVVKEILDAHQQWEEARQDELVRQLADLSQTARQLLVEIKGRS